MGSGLEVPSSPGGPATHWLLSRLSPHHVCSAMLRVSSSGDLVRYMSGSKAMMQQSPQHTEQPRDPHAILCQMLPRVYCLLSSLHALSRKYSAQCCITREEWNLARTSPLICPPGYSYEANLSSFSLDKANFFPTISP
jgi:hypothetical protein